MAPPLLLRFHVSPIVAREYRNFARQSRPVFKGDGSAHRTVRDKIKYLIRENPLNEPSEALKVQIRQLTETLVKGVVQARENPQRNSLFIDLRRDNIINGKVNIPRVPNQTIHRSGRYIKEMFSKCEHHPNAEVVKNEEKSANN